jgi:hypothetical protein
MSLNDAKDIALMLSEAESLVSGSLQESSLSRQGDIVQLANTLRKNWAKEVGTFVRVNPATQLTVRNTRTSLERFGYTFPERNFLSPELTEPLAMSEIRLALSEYLVSAYGKFEELNAAGSRVVSKGFVTSIYEQRFASSLWALRSSLERRRLKLESIFFNSMPAEEFDEDDLFEDAEDELETEIQGKMELTEVLKSALQNEINFIDDVISQINSLEKGPVEGDPKLIEARRLLSKSLESSKRIIVFSRYTDTLNALLETIGNDHRLSNASFGFYTGQDCWLQIRGKRNSVSKSQLQKALANKEIGFVLCSDAASEGINLQTASVLINVDVPWNPGRLEQRIGRIARLGQRAKVVDIANLWYPNSVEGVMYSRLLERKELYDLAVGAFPDLFAKGIRELVNIQAGTKLTFSGDILERLEELREKSHLDGLTKLWESDLSGNSKSSNVWNGLSDALRTVGAAMADHEGLNADRLYESPSNFGSSESNATLYKQFNEFGTWGYEIEFSSSGRRVTFGVSNISDLILAVFGGISEPEIASISSDSDWVPQHNKLNLVIDDSGILRSTPPHSENLEFEEIGKLKVSHEN